MPAIAGDLIIVGAHYGLAAFDSHNGRLIWRAKLWSREWDSNSRNVAVGDGHACMSDQRTVGCVDVASGRVLWSYDPPPGALTDGESAYANHRWFYGGSDHKVHAVDPETGKDIWSTDITPGARHPSRIFGVSVSGDTVYATTVRWLTPTGVPVVGDLVALNRADGSIIWTYTTHGRAGGFQGRALITDKLAIVNDAYYHSLIGIDRKTGTEVWRTPKDESGFLSSESTPVLVGDTVFAASSDTQIYAVSARTGEVLWRVLGSGDALGGIDVCPHTLVALEFAGGWPALVDRQMRRTLPPEALSDDLYISSRFAVVGNLAYAVGNGGVYAFHCD